MTKFAAVKSITHRDMKILITGCRGQLGTEMENILESEYPGITDYTDVDTLDLTDADAVRAFVAKGKYTHIINCAAYTAVDKAENDIDLCRRVNRDAIANIGAAASSNGAKVIHVSTDYVFDGTNCRPYREDDKENPVSAYGITKLEGEKALIANAPESIIIRTAWLYSPYGNNFVKTMLRLGRERESLGVVADQIGTPTYARDLACAIFHIITYPSWESGIYHFTDEGVASWYDFTKAIHRIAGITKCTVKPLSTDEYPTPAHRPQYSVLDKAKIKSTFGIKIPYWTDSLEDCISRLEKN